MCMSRFLQTAVLALCLIGAAPSWAQHLLEGGAPPRRSDYVGALKRWQPLAERGDAVAQYHLGVMYEFGFGVRKNEATALHWYHKAAEQGYAEAQHNLGLMYFPDDLVQTHRWVQKAAQQGYPRAQIRLGWLHAMGLGVKNDKTLAVYWYQQAAQQGNARAQYHLGLMYKYGEGVDEDQARALALFEQSADQGDSYGIRALAWLKDELKEPKP